VIEVPKIPKPADTIELPTRSGRAVTAKVARADWNENLGLFVISCQYANRSISAEEYGLLAEDPAWELKHLLD
jgi:hypothetical protein